jgi:8-amino-7-oxononanoate synthase
VSNPVLLTSTIEREGVTSSFEARLLCELEKFQVEHRLRKLQSPEGIDFTSNDYLGLARDEILRKSVAELIEKLPVSASGSRLLRGNHAWHTLAEERFAEYVGTEASLFFNSGYDANVAILSALPGKDDLLLYDRLVHASTREGIRLSLAPKRSVSHNSIEEFERGLQDRDRYRHVFLLAESLYSMDGDEAPLHALVELAQEYDAILVIDEAHATGVFGRHGRGLVDESGVANHVHIRMHTCGKALASYGAFVCGSRTMIEYLVNTARPFIFSTALPPIVPALVVQVLDRLLSGEDRATPVLHKAKWVRQALQKQLQRWKVLDGRSPILPIVIGSDSEALSAAQMLQQTGLDIRAIRPPTVAVGTSRLRIAINYLHTQFDLDHLIETLVTSEKILETTR